MNTKLCLNYISIIAIFLLVISCISVNAVTINDDTGDVWYSSVSNGWLWSSKNNTDHSNIDIKSVDYVLNESLITLKMTLKDEIDESKNVGYEIYYGNFTGRPYYLARYLTYSGAGRYYYISEIDVEDKGVLLNTISEDGMVFSATFIIENIDSSFEIWGQAYEDSDDYTERWVDFVPLKYEPELDDIETDGDGGGDSDDNVTADDDDETDDDGEGDSNGNDNTDDNETDNGEPVGLLLVVA